LCTQIVVYHTAGGTPGLAPTEGRKTSVPVKTAKQWSAGTREKSRIRQSNRIIVASCRG
jgi:hypothetical protein